MLLLLEEAEAMESKNEGSLFKSLFFAKHIRVISMHFPFPFSIPLESRLTLPNISNVQVKLLLNCSVLLPDFQLALLGGR